MTDYLADDLATARTSDGYLEVTPQLQVDLVAVAIFERGGHPRPSVVGLIDPRSWLRLLCAPVGTSRPSTIQSAG
ncbi:MAG TPA: hypothetical protein VK499_09760 [Propionibacteriaceae bacterium]|nr:hypothetical protein [Propionibacteriaceae bacterium]